MAQNLGVGEVSLNRWERENRKGHTKAMDTLIRMVYLALQDDEYTREASQQIRAALVRYFGKITIAAAPLSPEIDLMTCSSIEVIEKTEPAMLCSPSQSQQISAVYGFLYI
jgi:hypothetical protein